LSLDFNHVVSYFLFFYREVFPGLITPLSQSVIVCAADRAVRHQLPYKPGSYYSANVVTINHHTLVNVLNVSTSSSQH